ncbi:MAG: AAA family ATPase, partial [Nannocystaceae bacterium]
VGGQLEWPVHTWSSATGIDENNRPAALIGVLQTLLASQEPGLWVLFDADHHALDPRTLRAARELSHKQTGPVAIVVGQQPGPIAALPEVVHEHLPLPDPEALAGLVATLADRLDPPLSDQLDACEGSLAEAGLGLTTSGFKRLLREALLAGKSDDLVAWVRANKHAYLSGNNLLEQPSPVLPSHLGGLATYKTWLQRRAGALEPAARAAGIPPPRGVLLIGVQGCGKSLAARASASLLDLPLFRLDPGRLFGSTVGASERNLRQALQDAERCAPMVLWIDEIDKSLAGSQGAKSDAGTTSRVVSSLLTWLQERTRPVFVVMTANDIKELPPELIRRGRLDELFFVDLPGPKARRDILHVHLIVTPRDNLGHVPPLADDPEAFMALAEAAEGYSGAELEAALVEARLDAYTDNRPMAASDFQRSLAACVPLSRTRAESVQVLRRWADGRARRA